MPVELACVLIALTGVVGIGLVMASHERIWKRKIQKARDELAAYTDTRIEWEDLQIAKRGFELISGRLVQKAHAWAHQGHWAASALRASDAISPVAYNKLSALFEECLAETTLMAVLPDRLPWLRISTRSAHAHDAKAAWEKVKQEHRTLRRLSTHTLEVAKTNLYALG